MMPLDRDSVSPERKGKTRSPFSSLGGRVRSRDQPSSSLAPPLEEPPSIREEESTASPPRNVESANDGTNGIIGESTLGQSAPTDGAGPSSENRLQEPLQPSNAGQISEVGQP